MENLIQPYKQIFTPTPVKFVLSLGFSMIPVLMGKAVTYIYYMISCDHSDSTVVEYHIMGTLEGTSNNTINKFTGEEELEASSILYTVGIILWTKLSTSAINSWSTEMRLNRNTIPAPLNIFHMTTIYHSLGMALMIVYSICVLPLLFDRFSLIRKS